MKWAQASLKVVSKYRLKCPAPPPFLRAEAVSRRVLECVSQQALLEVGLQEGLGVCLEVPSKWVFKRALECLQIWFFSESPSAFGSLNRVNMSVSASPEDLKLCFNMHSTLSRTESPSAFKAGVLKCACKCFQNMSSSRHPRASKGGAIVHSEWVLRWVSKCLQCGSRTKCPSSVKVGRDVGVQVPFKCVTSCLQRWP